MDSAPPLVTVRHASSAEVAELGCSLLPVLTVGRFPSSRRALRGGSLRSGRGPPRAEAEGRSEA